MNARTYTPRPRVVEGVQLTMDNAQRVAEWCGGYVAQSRRTLGYIGVNVFCRDGVKRAGYGDWVIHDFEGTFDVVHESDFERLFEEAEPA